MRRAAMGAGQGDVSQTRSSSIPTRVKPSELFSSRVSEKFLITFQLCLRCSYDLPQWRAASLSRGDIGSLVIRCPSFPQLEDHARPLQGQGSYGGLVILASPALLAIQGLRPRGVLDGLTGTLVARLAEQCGAQPPEVCHGRFATSRHDRGHAGEGSPVRDGLIPTPIRAITQMFGVAASKVLAQSLLTRPSICTT
jgi:hypothetical protein